MSSRAKAPTGILRGMASISSAPARPPKTVRFCIPAPRIPDPAPGHAATTTPPRSPTSSSDEAVPDSAPAFPARGMAGPRAASPSVGSRGEAVFYTAGSHPIVRSIVVATSTQQRTGGNLALSPRDTALSARDDEGWLTPKKRRRPGAARLSHRLDGSNLLRSSMPSRRRAYYCSPRSNRAPNNHSSSSSSSRSRRSPVRRCRRCRASDHFAAACRDPVRCDRCDRSGHWARDCHQDCPAPLTALRAALPAPTRSQPWPPPPPSSAPCGGVVPEHGMDFFDASAPPPTPVPPARGRASSQRLRSVITGSLNLEASAPADCVAPALGSIPQHLLLDVVLRPPARRLVPSKEKLAGRHSASPTHARHAQSAPTSSTSSDLALGSQDHAHPARVLACERCYKMSVDDVLSAENKRTDLGLLQMQGKVGDRKTAESEVLLCLSTAATGEVLPEVCCSHPLLSPDAGLTVLLSPGDAPCEGGHPSVDVESVDGLTMVLISPGDALCDGGFSSEDDEDEEMEQLLPCLADLDQQELLLDGEEVGDWARRELEPVVDVIDADAEAAMIGNLLVADTHVNSDDDDVADAAGTTPTSGIVIRSVVDLFSLPVAPLLPMPIPPMPRADAALPAPDRRSGRLAAKRQLPAVGKAQRVLHKKMGFDFGAMPLVEATKEFTNACKKAPFSDSAICGLSTLLRLNLPSMTAADEALIGLAGPGGSDFPPPSALDVSA